MPTLEIVHMHAILWKQFTCHVEYEETNSRVKWTGQLIVGHNRSVKIKGGTFVYGPHLTAIGVLKSHAQAQIDVVTQADIDAAMSGNKGHS